MSDKQDGGPALPFATRTTGDFACTIIQPGMSLRDLFADTALKTFGLKVLETTSLEVDCDHAKYLAQFCYAVADAMIEARSK